MRRVFYILTLLLLCTLQMNAKWAYVPVYYTNIVMEDSLSISSDTCYLNTSSLSPCDNRFTITVLHDSLTDERIKAIQRIKAAKVLSNIAIVAGTISAVTSIALAPLTPLDAFRQSINYTNSLSVTGSAAFLSMLSESSLNSLQKLPISICIQNNSEHEITINDMSRGLFWYVRAYGRIFLSVGNPELNKFRIANADVLNPQPCYLAIDACNGVSNEEIRFEDEVYIYYDWIDFTNGRDDLTRFICKNKQTGKISKEVMLAEQAKEIKKRSKQYSKKH